MQQANTVEFIPGSQEELLPDFDEQFPHIMTHFAYREGPCAPWHWHSAVELFYVEKGSIVYTTPEGSVIFSEGSGGFVNSNVLHSTHCFQAELGDCQLNHLFDPGLIAGSPDSRIENRYVRPILTATNLEIVKLDPEQHADTLTVLRKSFQCKPNQLGYELAIRNALSQIWITLAEITAPWIQHVPQEMGSHEKLKQMLTFVHQHYGQKITVPEIAGAAGISQQTCTNLFQKHLRTTPMEYLNSYRLRMSCQMLTQTEYSVAEISEKCGMNNSYFSQVFRQSTGFTPLEYRRFYRRHQHSLHGR